MDCPICHAVLDGLSNLSDDEKPVPTAGDISLCIYCAGISVFTGEGLDKRVTTPEERVTFMSNPEIVRAISVIMDYNEQHSVETQ